MNKPRPITRRYIEPATRPHVGGLQGQALKTFRPGNVAPVVNQPVPEKIILPEQEKHIIDLTNLFTIHIYKDRAQGVLKSIWGRRQRAFALLTAVVMVVSAFQYAINKPAQAALNPSGASGKGLLVYSDGTTTPQKRQWNFGSSSFGAEAGTAVSRNPYQIVVKASPTVKDEWVKGVVGSDGTLEILRSADGGATWASGFTATGQATTRRSFDIAYEQNSGEAVVVYGGSSLSVRVWNGSSWSAEVSFSPGSVSGTGADRWIELAERAYSDELTVAFNNPNTLQAAIWNGASNSFSNGFESGEVCDFITLGGDSKCFDVNYLTGSGQPIIVWGVSSTGNSTFTIRATRWDGTNWFTSVISLGTNSDDANSMDCDADPSAGSMEVACISISNNTLDTQAWTLTYVGSGGTGCGTAVEYSCVVDANIDTAAHAAAAGRSLVAMTYVTSGGARRAIGTFADAADDGVFDASIFDGSTWLTDQTLTQSANGVNEENILAITNPYDNSEAMLVFSDTNSDLWASKISFSGSGTPTVTAVDGNATLEGSLANIDGRAFDMAFEPRIAPTKLTQEGYIWENEDGTTADGNTQQAAGNTAITGVKKGERLTLRTQIKNTGNGYLNDNLGLFYDRGDGIWSKVGSKTPAVTAAGNCTDTNWDCSTVQDLTANADYTSMAISPSGQPWVSFRGTDGTNGTLVVAQYVGNGGSGCTSVAWTCTTVDDPSFTAGSYTSIAFDPSGRPWIAYQNNGALWVAQYVGSSGTGCTGNTIWSCAVVVGPGVGGGSYLSVAFDPSGRPWIAYQNNTALWVAQYVGTGGTGCTSTAWTCTNVDATSNLGYYSSIAFDPFGTAWVGYRDATAESLKIARYVGTGGTGCTSTAWTCIHADDQAVESVGHDISLAFDVSGNAWVSYRGGFKLKLARYTPGSAASGGCAADWTCTIVDTDGGYYTSIAFDVSGNAWVSHQASSKLKLARYTPGSAASGGCAADWTCTPVDDPANNVGSTTSIAFDVSGNAWVSYQDSTAFALKVAQIKRGGEMVMAAGLAGASGDALSESHADMTTVPNDANRDDADCLTAGASWNNGKWFESEEGSGVNLKGGSVTAQCTEVSFTIDTSQAVAGRTYRFIIATDDAMRQDKGKWRGPIAVNSGAYATLTIEADSTQRFSKDNGAKFPDCTDTAWGCVAIDQDTDITGKYSSMVLDSDGNPWISYYDETATSLMVAHYVGSGGSGCGASGSTAWVCTTVDDPTNTVGRYSSIAVSANDTVWIGYYDSTVDSIKVAQYVGTGGSGCTSTAWTCETVDEPANSVGDYISMAIDPSGNARVSYRDITASSLKVAQYVGTGGSGCTGNTAWSCSTIDDTSGTTGLHTSIAIDPYGGTWVSYYEATLGTFHLRVAQYVRSGGTGCTGNTEWSCSTIDDTSANLGWHTSMAFDSNGKPWISFHDSTNTSLRVATKGGGFGSVCTDTAWTCGVVDNDAGDTGQHTSLAFDADNKPWISYYNATADTQSLMVAKYVGGTSGTGCGASGSTAWSCVTPDNTGTDTGQYTELAFDASGVPWVSYYDLTNTALRVTKLNAPTHKPTYEAKIKYPGRSAGKGDLRYALTLGKTRASGDGVCGGVIDSMGYCGVYTNDGFYDSVVAQANERPMFNFAQRFDNNATLPTAYWVGRSNVAPSTAGTAGDIKLQVYRFGTTNAWEDVKTNSTSTNCNTDNCAMEGIPTGTLSEYFEADGTNYWVYFRVWQTENTSGTETLKTDSFKAVQPQQYLRHGKHWQNASKSPLNW